MHCKAVIPYCFLNSFPEQLWLSKPHITLISAMDHADAAPEIPEEADAASSKRGWRWTFSAPACMMGGEAEG